MSWNSAHLEINFEAFSFQVKFSLFKFVCLELVNCSCMNDLVSGSLETSLWNIKNNVTTLERMCDFNIFHTLRFSASTWKNICHICFTPLDVQDSCQEFLCSQWRAQFIWPILDFALQEINCTVTKIPFLEAETVLTG